MVEREYSPRWLCKLTGAVVAMAMLQLLSSPAPVLAADGHGVHIAYLTDCTMYSDWQTVGMVFSFKRSRQPHDSQITRKLDRGVAYWRGFCGIGHGGCAKGPNRWPGVGLVPCGLRVSYAPSAYFATFFSSPAPVALAGIMCCTDEERKRYNEQLLSIVKTHVAPSFAKNEKTGDFVSAGRMGWQKE